MTVREPSHYLKPLSTTSTPKRFLWLDCEHTSNTEQGLTIDRWKSGVLGKTHFTSRKGERKDTMIVHDDAETLWQEADAFCTSNRRVVLWAHDLAYQLRVSQALYWLPRLGWHLDKIVLERTASWALFRDHDRSLMCCDLMAWAPGGIDHIAGEIESLRVYKSAVGINDVLPRSAAFYRAGVIRDAVMTILEWVEREELGQFRPTGSGQSYTAFRRRFMQHKILVHDNAERLHLERVAMWTGRTEAWQHGTLTDGPFVEYDMQAAYCNIAAACDVPTVARHVTIRPSALRVEHLMVNYAVMAECTITTDIPIAPASYGGRTLWPVGTFRTVIWDPEIRLALEHAQDITFHRVFAYDRAPALSDFANFTLGNMDPSTLDVHPVIRRVLKHWSRCLVGRLGLRYRAWHKFGTQDTHDLRLVSYVDADEGTSTDMLIAGQDRLILGEMSEALESVPQVPSWVMSECRRRLWMFMEYAGRDAVTYCDTDSVIVNPSRRHNLIVSDDTTALGIWAVRGRYSRMTIHGPRNLVCETDRRVAGLPLTARQTAPLEFSGQVMRSIKESMRAGELDCVASVPRQFIFDTPDLRREHLPNHQTQPFRVSLDTGAPEDDVT